MLILLILSIEGSLSYLQKGNIISALEMRNRSTYLFIALLKSPSGILAV